MFTVSILVPFWATIDHKTNFTQNTFYSSFISKKSCTFHPRSFEKHPLFTTLILVFTVDEVCYISNKYQAPYNLAKRQYFYTKDFISLFHFGSENWRSSSQMFFETSTFFITFSLFLKVSEVCNISSKCWLPNKSVNKRFLRKTPHTPPLFKKKKCAFHRRCF